MSRTIKVCDCFLDVSVYCLSINNFFYADFFHHCLQTKNYMIMTAKND